MGEKTCIFDNIKKHFIRLERKNIKTFCVVKSHTFLEWVGGGCFDQFCWLDHWLQDRQTELLGYLICGFSRVLYVPLYSETQLLS